ncbi:MAG: hypothetical protein Q7R63_00900 [bacterium]|nr:hypothetical protein [bacterium]
MPYFRIAVIPRGAAPREVREAWIGVALPFDMPCEKSHERRLISGERQLDRPFMTVPAAVALEELGKKSPEAAQWFYDNLSPSFLQSGNFTFGISELEITELKAGVVDKK